MDDRKPPAANVEAASLKPPARKGSETDALDRAPSYVRVQADEDEKVKTRTSLSNSNSNSNSSSSASASASASAYPSQQAKLDHLGRLGAISERSEPKPKLSLAPGVTESGREIREIKDLDEDVGPYPSSNNISNNMTGLCSAPGALKMQGPDASSQKSLGDVSYKSAADMKSAELSPKDGHHQDIQALTVVAELAIDTEVIEQERDDLKRQLDEERNARASSEPIFASVCEASQRIPQVDSSKTNRKYLYMAALLIVIAVGVVVTIAIVASANDGGSGGSTGPPEEQFFDQLGSSIDGSNAYEQFGSSISMNHDGTRFAVADNEAVYLYGYDQLKSGSDTKDWILHGAPIAPVDCGTSTDGDSLAIRSNILVDLSRNGKIVAIGCPFASHVLDGTTQEYTGRVELYQEVGDGWELLGSPIYGKQAKSYFGGTVSLSGTGGILVIGSPGSEGGVSVWAINAGDWIQFGKSIDATSMLLSVASLSLSTDGTVMAVGGVPLEEGDSVVRIFHFLLGEWADKGSGIEGILQDTSYVCDLSGNGQVVAVSNYYVGNAGPAQGGLNDALDVRAFEWSEAANEWVLLGENLHSSAPGQKSGYFISLSDDGKLMGMGDPGRRIDSGAVAGHSHIYYWTGETWIQLGPNKEGEGAGDQFGFGVSFSSDASTYAVAAPFSRGKGYEHGRVYVYDIDIEPYIN